MNIESYHISFDHITSGRRALDGEEEAHCEWVEGKQVPAQSCPVDGLRKVRV